MHDVDQSVRRKIFEAALKKFAERGYAGATVQEIIAETAFSKPTLYYHFQSKEGLFKALVEYACDQSYHLMEQAAGTASTLEGQLTEILTAVFDFSRENRDLMRLAFATAFAAPGEIPEDIKNMEKRRRNYEFVHSIIQAGLERGDLDSQFASTELTNGVYGALSFHLMANLICQDSPLDRRAAQRIIHLYLEGARSKSKK